MTIRSRIHVTVAVEQTAKDDPQDYQWVAASKVETRIVMDHTTEEAAQMSVLDAVGSAVRMAGAIEAWQEPVTFAGIENKPEFPTIAEHAHHIAGAEPVGEARSAGEVAAFLADDGPEDPRAMRDVPTAAEAVAEAGIDEPVLLTVDEPDPLRAAAAARLADDDEDHPF